MNADSKCYIYDSGKVSETVKNWHIKGHYKTVCTYAKRAIKEDQVKQESKTDLPKDNQLSQWTVTVLQKLRFSRYE